MKLRNRKSGQIGNFIINKDHFECVDLDYVPEYRKLAELNAEWKDALEGVDEKKYGGRVPKKGDKYWYICASGSLEDIFWDSKKWDADRFESGSAFWTREEAEKELKRRKAYVILKEDAKGFVPDYKNKDVMKCLVFYDWRKSTFGVTTRYVCQQEALVFATKEDARVSTEKHRQQWIDFLGIEEDA